MKKTRFIQTQIVGAIKEYQAGKSVCELYRESGINKAPYRFFAFGFKDTTCLS